jgi:hypothetical protein
MAVDVHVTGTEGGLDLGQDFRHPGDHTRVVHQLRHAERPRLLGQEPFDVLGGDRGSTRLERTGRDAGGRHDEGVQGNGSGPGQQGPHAVQPEHVGDLVRIQDHRGRAVGQDRPGELIEHELGRLQVHVAVDEPGEENLARRVEGRPSFVA